MWYRATASVSGKVDLYFEAKNPQEVEKIFYERYICGFCPTKINNVRIVSEDKKTIIHL